MSMANQYLMIEQYDGIPAITNDDWYTPPWIFDAAGLTFDIDVAAPVNALVRTCPARRYFTVIENGLIQPWDGLVWCNPPFSNPSPWVDRWIECEGIILLPIAGKSKWRKTVLKHCDALSIIDCEFKRPNGSGGFPYALTVLARGQIAVEAVWRIAQADDGFSFHPRKIA